MTEERLGDTMNPLDGTVGWTADAVIPPRLRRKEATSLAGLRPHSYARTLNVRKLLWRWEDPVLDTSRLQCCL